MIDIIQNPVNLFTHVLLQIDFQAVLVHPVVRGQLVYDLKKKACDLAQIRMFHIQISEQQRFDQDPQIPVVAGCI